MTPDRARAPGHDARSRAGRPAADLGAVRRSDAIIDLLAGRRRIGAHVLRDPAVALLRSLAADVDAPAPPARPRRHAGRRHAGRHHAPGAWPHAAAAAAAAAAIAMLTAVAAAALVLVGMLARLSATRARLPSPPAPPRRRRW